VNKKFIKLSHLIHLLLLLILALLVWRRTRSFSNWQRIGEHLLINILFLETLIVLILSPLLTSNLINVKRDNSLFSSLVISLVSLTSLQVVAFLISLIINLNSKGLPPIKLTSSYLLLLVFILSFGTLGFFWSTFFNKLYVSLSITYLIIFLLSGGIILAGPLIESLYRPYPLIQTVLFLNPFVAVYSAIDLDFMRIPLIYNLSPIASYRFHYPSWIKVALFYISISALLISSAILVLKARRRNER